MQAAVHKLFGFYALTLLCGCGSGDSYNQYFDVLSQSVQGIMHVQRISRDTAAGIPYATLGYRVGGSPEALLILATQNGDDLLWTSSAHVTFHTVSGRLQRTVGLEHDLTASNPAGTSALPPPSAALRAPFSSKRIQDFADINVYSVSVNCIAVARGQETVTILGTRLKTRRVEENCASPALNWRFTDNYWVDPDNGFVWRSRQHIHPKADVVNIEVLRPPE
jgi:hypothetical protein